MNEHFSLNVKDLMVAFDGAYVFKAEEFVLSAGQKLLLTGASGCGKTVFLKALMGLLPQKAVRGWFEISPDGKSSERLSYGEYRRCFIRSAVSVVFQDAVANLHPYRKVGRQCPPHRDPHDRAKWEEFLLDPDGLGDRFPEQCSGGECQRLSLLFPYFDEHREVILLDEPLTDIDYLSHKNIQGCIKRLLDEPKRTVILVSHEWKDWRDWLPGEMIVYMIRDRSLTYSGLLRDNKAKRTDWPRATECSEQTAEFVVRIKSPWRFDSGSTAGLLALDDPLKVRTGDGLTILGESGCGKTTLLKMMAGLLPAGAYGLNMGVQISENNKLSPPFHELQRKDRCGTVQLVPQNASGSVFLNETLGSHLRWIRTLRNAEAEVFKNGTIALAEKLRLLTRNHEMEDRRLGVLSVGMLRRFMLLRALLLLDAFDTEARQHPKLLLVDEVTRGLGEKDKDRLVGVITEFRKEHSAAVIAVTHDLKLVPRISTNFRMMFHGMVLPQTFPSGILDGDVADEDRLRLPNPYYLDFLMGVERKKVRNGENIGCHYARFLECPNMGKLELGCRHDELRRRGRVGICC